MLTNIRTESVSATNQIRPSLILRALRELMAVILLVAISFLFLFTVSVFLEFVSVNRHHESSVDRDSPQVEQVQDDQSSWGNAGVAQFIEEGF